MSKVFFIQGIDGIVICLHEGRRFIFELFTWWLQPADDILCSFLVSIFIANDIWHATCADDWYFHKAHRSPV